MVGWVGGWVGGWLGGWVGGEGVAPKSMEA